MSLSVWRAFKTADADLQDGGTTDPRRTPATPIRTGRNTPGGMVAVFVLIGFVIVAVALFA